MKKILLGLATVAATIAPAHAVTLYGVDEVNNLIRFDSRNPGVVQRSVAITGLGGSSVLGIDFRVRDGLLYALTDNNRVYTVNYNTGAARLLTSVALTGSNFAVDFNPTNTNLRLVSNDNTNYVLRFNPAPLALVPGVNVAYAAGTTGLGDPDIISAGYTNNDNNAATGTTLFVLDSANDILATQNAATGVLTAVGALGVNIGARTSFDISGLNNNAFVQAGNTLYNINLTTGALSAIGNTDRTLFGLTAAVPEPSTWAMMMIGFGAVGAAARSSRRRRKTVTA